MIILNFYGFLFELLFLILSNIILVINNKKKYGGIILEYKWTAMTNIFIATLMGSINMMIVLIALPAIFNGIHVDPPS